MSEENTNQTININGKDLTSEDVIKLQADAALANESQRSIEVGNFVNDALAAAAEGDLSGVNDLRAYLDKAHPEVEKTELPKLEALTLDASATTNEKAIADYLTKQSEAFNRSQDQREELKGELNDLVNNALNTVHAETSASKAVKQVKAELGLDVTAEEIKIAMKKEGINDPVKAVKLARFDDIKVSPLPALKPNMVIDDSFDMKAFDKMTLHEKMQLPQDVKEQILDKQRAAAATKNPLADTF